MPCDWLLVDGSSLIFRAFYGVQRRVTDAGALRTAAIGGFLFRLARLIVERSPVRIGVAEGELARVSSRRGSVEAPVHIDATLRAGLAFMTLHFPDQVATNVLTLDAWDPKSGTAEFKATAIRVDKTSTTAGDGRRQHAKAGA